ncbi:MAG: serine/threonine protein kinase, partial [Planctomycetes bacterium]|nr:serine/threonine protein kinase [Planctomycetota bacterium]
MTNQADTPEDALERFREAFRDDIASESVKTVLEYASAFPSISDDIALEFAAWKNATSTKEGHIGPYRIKRELGRGGQAVVYLCDDERLRRKVAVKVLLGLGGASEETLTRFRREAQITSQLDHPGICALYETGIGQGGAPWISMRYVEGKPLSTVLAETRGNGETNESFIVDFSILDDYSDPKDDTPTSVTTHDSTTQPNRKELWRLLKLIEKVARTLHVAHESGIVHRDIKPGNIMVTKDGEPVVLDFGLASADADGQPTVTRSGELMGTPAYMSPEQIAAHRIRLDRRTDIWSLGVTLYECLTCRRPFEAPSREGLYREILTREPEDVRRLNPAIPAELGIVLKTAMDKDADRRYATAEDFAEDLRCVREMKPIAAQPMSAWLRTRRWAQRNPAIATMMAAVFLLTTAVAVVMFVKNRELDRSNSALTTKTEEATANASKATANAEQATRNMELAE